MIDGSWRQKDFSGYDVVYHVAGIAHVNAKKNMESLYYKINTDLAIETAQHAKDCGVKQFIFMSSMIVYGESKSLKPVIITKETVPKPNGFYGNSKLQAEIGIRTLEDKDFKVVILRPPMIYGPDSKGNYAKLAKIAIKFRFFPKINNERSMLYIGNLVEFVRIMIKFEEHGTFYPQNRECSETSRLVTMIAEEHGKETKLIGGLGWILKIISYMTINVNKAFGNFAYDSSMSEYREEYRLYTLEQSIKETET
jgi:UDP-glucose 4-epimerase